MRPRIFKISLLALYLFWTSGFAHFLHERYEHETASAVTVADVYARPDGGAQYNVAGAPDHDEDGCAICSMLATMIASHETVPPVTLVAQLVEISPPPPAENPFCPCLSNPPPARGPPASL